VGAHTGYQRRRAADVVGNNIEEKPRTNALTARTEVIPMAKVLEGQRNLGPLDLNERVDSIPRSSGRSRSEESGEKCSRSGKEADANVHIGNVVESVGSVGLSDVGDRRDGVAVIAGLVGARAGLAALTAPSVWLLATKRRLAGSFYLLLVALGLAVLWKSS
jgi:hypothetical protein